MCSSPPRSVFRQYLVFYRNAPGAWLLQNFSSKSYALRNSAVVRAPPQRCAVLSASLLSPRMSGCFINAFSFSACVPRQIRPRKETSYGDGLTSLLPGEIGFAPLPSSQSGRRSIADSLGLIVWQKISNALVLEKSVLFGTPLPADLCSRGETFHLSSSG